MDSLNQDTNLTLQGCGYRIENDRILISIQQIANYRAEENLSGTLRLQLCAFRQDTHNTPTEAVLASTTIGEIKGQHFLSHCDYDLIFQQPPAGSWQLALQLSEWNGVDYTVCDSVYFANHYQSAISSLSEQVSEAEQVSESTDDSKQEAILAAIPSAPSKAENIKKNLTGYSDGYLAINKAKMEKLLKVKGVSKKVLEKLVAERPFRSEKAVLNVKGMGPVMLNKILSELML